MPAGCCQQCGLAMSVSSHHTCFRLWNVKIVLCMVNCGTQRRERTMQGLGLVLDAEGMLGNKRSKRCAYLFALLPLCCM